MRNAIIAALWGAAATAQGPTPGAPAIPSEPFDHYRQATVSIGQVRVDAGKNVFATNGGGVVISADGHRACLLTAKHMFFDPSQGWIPTQVNVRVPRPVGSSAQPEDFGVVLPLVENGMNLWRSPDDGSDLAVIPIPPGLLSRLKDAVGVADIGTADDVYQGASILVLGYPALVAEDYLSTPLARAGIISWDKADDPQGHPFLVDANLYPGNSGGPVFHVRSGLNRSGGITVGGGIALIGIVSKGAVENAQVFAGDQPITATNTQTGKISPAEARVLGVGGIGIIEPVARAKPILDECLSQS